MATARYHRAAWWIYSLLAVLLTWPLVGHISTHVPGNGIDDPSLAWNLWWVKHRLVEQLQWDIFHADWMFYPIEINLSFYTLTPLNGLISTPLQWIVSLIATSNLVLLSSYVIGGYGAYLLCQWLLVHNPQVAHDHQGQQPFSTQSIRRRIQLAALFGGGVYAFASAKLFYAALGQFNIASSQWVPFCLLYLLRIHQRSERAWRWRNILLCGLFLILQAWSELTYASFLIIFIVLYATWILAREILSYLGRKQAEDNKYTWSSLGQQVVSLATPFVTLAFLFLIGISPFLAAMIPDMLTEGDFFQSGGGFSEWFSADLVGYLIPTRLHPVVGPWVGTLHQSGFSNDVGQHIYLGYTLFVLIFLGLFALWAQSSQTKSTKDGRSLLAALGALRPPVGGWFWATNLLLFWLLTLGPNPRWFGEPFAIPGPFALVSQLPIFSGNRYPSRYVIMLLVVAAVLAAYGLNWLLNRNRLQRRTWIIGALVSLLFLAEHLSVPLPLNQSTTPPIYKQIAAMPGEFTVLELPTGWRNGAYVLGKSDKLIMMQQWYQSIHEKRRLGGNTSRNPWYKFEYFVNAPVLGNLIALMNAEQEHFAPVVYGQIDEPDSRSRSQAFPSGDHLSAMIAHSQEHAPTVFEFFDIELVTVRVEKSSPALLQLINDALPLTLVDEWEGTDWDDEKETIRLYRVEPRTSNDAGRGKTFTLGGALSPLYLAEGWSALPGPDGARYALRKQLDLLVDLPNVAGTLEVDWQGNPPQLALNGSPLEGDGSLNSMNAQGQNQTGTSRFALPVGIAVRSIDRLTLTFDGEPMPFNGLADSIDSQGWPVGETGIVLPAESAILAMSAGAESGKFARIYVNGTNLAGAERGYHLAAISADGTLLATDAFDTIADLSESPRMAAWIRQWPAGTVIAGAAADAVDTHEGTMLSEDAVNALREVGVANSMRGKHRWAHAFVGAVGATPSSAVESSQLIGVASASVGIPLDGKEAMGAVFEVRFIE